MDFFASDERGMQEEEEKYLRMIAANVLSVK